MKRTLFLIFMMTVVLIISNSIVQSVTQTHISVDQWMILLNISNDHLIESMVKLPKEYDLKILNKDDYFDGGIVYFSQKNVNTDIKVINEEIQYELSLLGYRFKGKGIYLDMTGLSLQKIWIDILNDERRVTFHDVRISSEEASIIGIYDGITETITLPSRWDIEMKEVIFDINGLRYAGEVSFRLENSLEPIVFTFSDLIVDQNTEWTDIKIFSEYGYQFESGIGLKYLHGILSKDSIRIQQAEMVIPDENGLQCITLGNFLITPCEWTGDYLVLENDKGFYSEAFTYKFENENYFVKENSINFTYDYSIEFVGERRIYITDFEEHELLLNFVSYPNYLGYKYTRYHYFTGRSKINGFSFTFEDHKVECDGFINFNRGKVELPILDFPNDDELTSILLNDSRWGEQGFDWGKIKVNDSYLNGILLNELIFIRVNSLHFEKGKLFLMGELRLRGQFRNNNSLKLHPLVVDPIHGVVGAYYAEPDPDHPYIIDTKGWELDVDKVKAKDNGVWLYGRLRLKAREVIPIDLMEKINSGNMGDLNEFYIENVFIPLDGQIDFSKARLTKISDFVATS